MAERSRLPLFVLLALLLAHSHAIAAEALPKDSPFVPPAGADGVPAAAVGAYSLVGMTEVGKDTLLSITRESDKRSQWIPVGKTVGEITALSYDPKREQAVIRIEGKEHTLTMRKAVIVPAPDAPPPPAPSPAATLSSPPPSPTATQPPAGQDPVPLPAKMPPMTAQEEKEMEARMLVTDLLEIGQQQRKAYEEAMRKAAAEKAARAAQPPSAPASPPANPASKK